MRRLPCFTKAAELPSVSILGSSGAGKSVILDRCAELGPLTSEHGEHSVVGIACHEWDTWESFLTDPGRYAFANQMEALRKTFDTLVRAERLSGPFDYVVTDASPMRVKMYTEIMFDVDLLSPEQFGRWQSEYRHQLTRIPRSAAFLYLVLDTGERALRDGAEGRDGRWSNGDQLKALLDARFDDLLGERRATGELGTTVVASATPAEMLADFRNRLLEDARTRHDGRVRE